MDNMPRNARNWAEVELCRWQTGELPTTKSPPLDVQKAVVMILASFADASPENWIDPFNLRVVITYLSHWLEDAALRERCRAMAEIEEWREDLIDRVKALLQDILAHTSP